MDVDFVIDPTMGQLDPLVTPLLASGAYVSLEAGHDAFLNRTMFSVIDPDTGWKADLIIRKDRPFSEKEFGRRQAVERWIDVRGVRTEWELALTDGNRS